jgi:hypothetical protein
MKVSQSAKCFIDYHRMKKKARSETMNTFLQGLPLSSVTEKGNP